MELRGSRRSTTKRTTMSASHKCEIDRIPDRSAWRPVVSDAAFRSLQTLMYAHTGIALTDSKRALVAARLEKRMRELHFQTLGEYVELVTKQESGSAEHQELINCLTTNETSFFRESHHFDFLRDVVFPQCEERAALEGQRRLRIWSAGCSKGNEPYSIGMQVLDYPGFDRRWDIRILASDVSTRVLDVAQRGIYSAEQLRTLDKESLHKYFLCGTGTFAGLYQARPELRQLTVFRRLNFMEWPWPVRTQFDVVFCRNVLIYFDPEARRTTLQRLSEYVRPGGYLILGHAERPHWLSRTLSSVGNTVYQRTDIAQDLDHDSPGVPHVAWPTQPPSSSRCTSRRPATRYERGTVPVPRRTTLPAELCDSTLAHRPIVAGDLYAARESTIISTVLGSCVTACLFDPQTGIGGMNHFMLPNADANNISCARFGIHAMEILINNILQLGGARERLQAKVFGGANLCPAPGGLPSVGNANVQFVREYLRTDKIPIVAERLAGNQALRIHFVSGTGQVFVKPLPKSDPVVDSEVRFARCEQMRLKQLDRDSVTLF